MGAFVVSLLLILSAAQTTYSYAYHLDPYFKVVMDMSNDEEVIGTTLRAVPLATMVYVYEYPNLGSIVYHSRHLLILKLAASSTPPVGSYVIVGSKSLESFKNTFTTTKTTSVYQGPEVSLLKVEH